VSEEQADPGAAASGSARAAIVHLVEEGIVPRRPVQEDPDPNLRAVEILQARIALEGLTARRAAENITPAAARELASILARIRTSIDRGDLADASRANAELHREITSLSGHGVAQHLIAALSSTEVSARCRTILDEGRPTASLAEHAAVVDAVVSGDPDRAERAMRDHLESVCEALRSADARRS